MTSKTPWRVAPCHIYVFDVFSHMKSEKHQSGVFPAGTCQGITMECQCPLPRPGGCGHESISFRGDFLALAREIRWNLHACEGHVVFFEGFVPCRHSLLSIKTADCVGQASAKTPGCPVHASSCSARLLHRRLNPRRCRRRRSSSVLHRLS